MATYMSPWPSAPSPIHPHQAMGHHYMDQSMGHWPIPTSLPQHQSIQQHPSHNLSLLQHMTQPQSLRPQPSPNQLPPQQPHSQAPPVPHSQAMAPSQQPLPPPLSLSLPEPLSMQQHPHAQHNQHYSQPVPHQVVGQQGIRGVLPTSSGDPSSPDDGCEPEQDEKDGSWPCKCCGKRYRHAKHLRRHHSRHTGETPYECPLCQRRFGRSDVLKRHYHKCATRRGQPVGDHLAGQRGHPRRQRVKGQMIEIGPNGIPEEDSPIGSGPIDVKPPITPVTHSMDTMNHAYMG